MNQERFISSTSNPKIKHFIQLKEKSKVRNSTGECAIEGQKEIEMALNGQYELTQVFYVSRIANSQLLKNLQNQNSLQYYEVSDEVYQKLAHRGSTEGIVAIAKTKNHDLKSLLLTQPNPLILVAEAPEKPGNIGALLRTADAAALDAVIIANPRGDLYNPNIVRASLGCIFTVPTYTASTEEVLSFLKEHQISSFAAELEASLPYTQVDFKGATAIVVGTEASGLEEAWLKNSTQNVIIPMNGFIDSMNVSVAAAILLFEAVRQRS